MRIRIPNVKVTFREARDVRTVWESLPGFKLGEITLDEFIAIQGVAAQFDKIYASKDTELTGIKANRDDNSYRRSTSVTVDSSFEKPYSRQAPRTRTSERVA